MNYKQRILELRQEGKSYSQIISILGCSQGLISYYCNKDKHHPFKSKLKMFKKQPYQRKSQKVKASLRRRLTAKVYEFIRKINMDTEFTIEDVIAKFGEHPICYLTGLEIDIYKPSTYEFDHIIPKSRGGSNTLDNLGICIKSANRAKQDMTPDEFVNLCRLVISHTT